MKNPLSMEAFADWLSRRPEDEEYEFWCTDCAIGTYLKENGFALARLGVASWTDADGHAHDLPPGFSFVAMTLPYTYGAAADRARARLTEA